MAVIVNLDELTQYLEGARARFGDPAKPVFLLAVNFSPITKLQNGDVRAQYNPAISSLTLDFGGSLLTIEISPDGAIFEKDKLLAFHIRKLCSGIWAISPSLNMPGILHAFLVLHNVPEPAPWERMIFLASEAAHA